jgi:hypothetical protein
MKMTNRLHSEALLQTFINKAQHNKLDKLDFETEDQNDECIRVC